MDLKKHDLALETKINFKTITTDHYEKLKSYFNEDYTLNPKYVYKLCSNGYIHFVVMEKKLDILTNESREDIIDHDYAKFRSNKLFVKQIINLKTMENCSEVINSITLGPDRKYTTYTVNQDVIPDEFDLDLNKICTTGIHYYKTIHATYFLAQFPREKKYTGFWFECYDNGKLLKIAEYDIGFKL